MFFSLACLHVSIFPSDPRDPKPGKSSIPSTSEKIELIFSANPIELKKWIVTDNHEIETTVGLLNIKKKILFCLYIL